MKTKFDRKVKKHLLLSIILIIAFISRLYKIDQPLADWHSWRQADTAAVTRRYLETGIDLLHPRYDDLSSIASGRDNPEGWRFVEFPLINGMTAYIYNLLPFFSLEALSRLVSVGFSLAAILVLYFLALEFTSKDTALIASAAFAFLPFNLFYHRTILPEVPLLFFTISTLLFFKLWLKSERKIHYILSLVSFAIGILIKPFILFTAPALIYLTFKNWGYKSLKKTALYLYLIMAILPFAFWRIWASQFPEGIPAYTWLLNGNGIRFRPAFFRWIFAERIGKLILGYWGVAPFVIGLLRKPKKKMGWFFHWWFVGQLLYLAVFATGNVTHDYYQIFIIPPIAVFVALGIKEILTSPRFNRAVSRILLIAALAFGLAFSWYHIRDFYNINRPEIVAAGEAADAILLKNAKVIAPYGGDTAFLYQIRRQGWPIGGDIEAKIDKGATDYVSVIFDEETESLTKRCRPSIEFDEFVIISLRNCSI